MNKAQDTRKKGKIFVVSAPAGTGKTTLVEKLLKEFPALVRSVTTTTRQPRPQELDGVDYHFIERTAFEEQRQAGNWLETVELYGEYYGTSRRDVESLLQQGKDVILVIDTNGCRRIRDSGLPAVTIMVLPPSLDVLEERLRHRHTESEQKIQERLVWAKEELRRAKEYEYIVVNDDLQEAYQILKSIFIAEHHRQKPSD